ncbi:J domain-containing protein [Aphelenchoides bicaudatus]|nr:J domain-containing protein [Aphelenchoides bicaudatus]
MRSILILLLLVGLTEAVGLAKGLYCGLEICYDVLGIDRETFDKNTLSKAYRQLARQYHPDRIRTQDEQKKHAALERFRLIATAYETLKDDETRTYYDYYLDHPEERYYNYYQYYRLRAAPKVDVRLVILGTILLVSTFQYLSAKQKYSEALKYAKDQLKFRDILLEFDKYGKIKKKQANGSDVEEVLGLIIEEKISISGGYKKESLNDTLLVWILLSPVTLYKQAIWWSKWILKYWIHNEEYDEEAKMYLIRKNLKISEDQLNSMEDEVIEEYFANEIWKPTEFKQFKERKEAEEREKLANSGRYKVGHLVVDPIIKRIFFQQYRRYMKKNAGQTISFVDDL